MISILIPTYNYDCSTLIRDLCTQAEQLKQHDDMGGFDYEVIVAEDGSNDSATIAANKAALQAFGAQHICLDENIGRACIRNLLVSKARFPYQLIIDSDALVCTPDFLKNYWMQRDAADVVCGRIQTPALCPEGCELRYNYEQNAEGKRSMAYKEKHPYRHFSTFNVMFHHYVFQTLQFDERCTEYGYEDALMGIMLQQEGYSIAHANLPLIHNGMDTNADFLRKTETSLRVLRRLGEPMQSYSNVARIEKCLRRMRLVHPIHLLLKMQRSKMRKNLLSNKPSLRQLQLYKLLYYIETYNKII